jgi:hypothetical protein
MTNLAQQQQQQQQHISHGTNGTTMLQDMFSVRGRNEMKQGRAGFDAAFGGVRQSREGGISGRRQAYQANRRPGETAPRGARCFFSGQPWMLDAHGFRNSKGRQMTDGRTPGCGALQQQSVSQSVRQAGRQLAVSQRGTPPFTLLTNVKDQVKEDRGYKSDTKQPRVLY